MLQAIGPTLPFSEQLHASKYRLRGETFSEAMTRIAARLKDNDKHFEALRPVLLDMRFLPGGRIQTAIGSTRNVTAYNCFVSGKIEDTFVHGPGSIMGRAVQAATTLRMGGGIGYGFGTLRPRGALIHGLQSKSTGPVSFMNIYNALGDCTASVGDRRGAQMAVMPIWHPDIQEFVMCKANPYQYQRFNVSVGVTDEFMECLAAGAPFDLRFGGEVFKTVDSAELWESIMRTTWDWAEPGVLFMDRINEMNNLWYCEQIDATNPCGEQPLPPFGACLLGSFNLVKYLIRNDVSVYSFDFQQLMQDIPHVVRAMDNVIDNTSYPLPEQETEAKNKRRMGLGVAGLANAGEALGFPYGSPEFLRFEEKVLRVITEHCYMASVDLAREKGTFPLFDADKYSRGKFIQTLNPSIKHDIKRYGIRNSHLTSIAPTGTISQCADYVSSSIEPMFDYVTKRAVNMPDGPVIVSCEDYAFGKLGVRGKRCCDVTLDEHINVLLTAQRYVDSAVSKTCNVPANTKWEDFKNVYQKVFDGGGKGCTTYRIGCKRGAVLTETSAASCSIDPITGEKSCGG